MPLLRLFAGGKDQRGRNGQTIAEVFGRNGRTGVFDGNLHQVITVWQPTTIVSPVGV